MIYMQMLVILRQKVILKLLRDKLKKLKILLKKSIKEINNIWKADLVQKNGLKN